MGAVVGEEADAPGLVLEQDEVLTEHADGLGWAVVREVGGDGDGVPVAPEQFARGCAGADPRKQVVLLLREHRCTSSVRTYRLREGTLLLSNERVYAASVSSGAGRR